MSGRTYSVIYGRVISGRDVEREFQDMELAIAEMTLDERRGAALGQFRSHWGYSNGIFVGVRLGFFDTDSGIISLDDLSFEPTPEQAAEVDRAIAALPESFRNSRSLKPLGVHLVDLEW